MSSNQRPTIYSFQGGRLSPMRRVQTGMTSVITKESAADVKGDVERDLLTHCRVAKTRELIKRLLPVEKETVKKIFKALKKDKIYDKNTKRWKDFPVGNAGKENDLYLPFVNAANAIRVAASECSVSSDDALDSRSTRWIDHHSKAPMSQDTNAAKIRPDCVLALSQVQACVDELDKEGDLSAEKKKAMETTLLWLEIVAPVEIKRSPTEDWQEVVKQLIGYQRRILREQLDRRFVIGLLVENSKLTLWMHDRSGVLGTDLSIDIHQRPKTFIQIIAAFSILPAAKLGYDPTMELYVSRDIVRPSYRLGRQEIKQVFKVDPYDRKWVITMNNGDKYLTIRGLSLAHAGVMRGRGTLAYIAILFVAVTVVLTATPQVFVIKQSWRPSDVLSEGDLYDKAKASESEYVGAIDLCEEVLVGGEKDDTVSLIRKNILHQPPQEQSKDVRGRDEKKESYLHVGCVREDQISFSIHNCHDVLARVRTRVLLSTYGWPIKYFSSLEELVQVMRDAIEGHRHLFRNGVLHRDISPGNLIVKCPQPLFQLTAPKLQEGRWKFRGCVIDLDRAKPGKSKEPEKSVLDDRPSQNERQLEESRKLISSMILYQTRLVDLEFQNGLLDFIAEKEIKIPYAIEAIQSALKLGNITSKICTRESLGWRQISVRHDYQFSGHELQLGSRTGTPPYTSGEILSGTLYFPSEPFAAIGAERKDRHQLYHHAVHDLESFFWVLVYICLTRCGPGGRRRPELTTTEKKDPSALQVVVWCFFDADIETLRTNKQEIYKNPGDFETYILDLFHPYFQPLKGLVFKWFGILNLAYKFRKFEWDNIHDMFLAAMEETIKKIGPTSEERDKRLTKEVLDHRERDITSIQAAFKQILDLRTGGELPQQLDKGTTWEVSPPSGHQLAPRHYTGSLVPPESPTPKSKRFRKGS